MVRAGRAWNLAEIIFDLELRRALSRSEDPARLARTFLPTLAYGCYTQPDHKTSETPENNGPGARAGKRSTESRLSFFKLTLCIQSFSHHPTLIATPAQDHKAYLHASKLFMRPPTLKDAHTHNTMITSHVKLRSRARPDQHRSQSYSTRVVVRQNRPLETARLSGDITSSVLLHSCKLPLS